MSPDERRAAILHAARPLVLEHGRAVTTRLIAEAAGVAEGTVFRVFDTKDELIDAVLVQEFDPDAFLDAIDAIDPDLPVQARLLAAVTLLQHRFVGIFALMTALGVPKPPEHLQTEAHKQRLQEGGLVSVLQPDAASFRVSVEEVVALVRMLTFSGSHPHIGGPDRMSPEQIVDVVLHGVLRHPDGDHPGDHHGGRQGSGR